MMSWAIISDVDINSEVIRWAGAPRFTVWGVYRVFSLRHYQGELELTGMECHNNSIPTLEEIDQQTSLLSINKNFKLLSILNCPYISTDIKTAPLSRIDDGTNDITLITSEKSRLQLARSLIAIDDGDYFNKDGTVNQGMGLQYFKAKEWRINPARKGPVPENLNFRLPEGT